MKGMSLSILASVLIFGCAPMGRAPNHQTGSGRSDDLERFAVGPAPATSDEHHQRIAQIAFLKSLREADPDHEMVAQAVMDQENKLAIVLGRKVGVERVPDFLRTLLKQMAETFPGEDPTIIVFGPTKPPTGIGIAHLNIKTHEMLFIPLSPADSSRDDFLVRC